MPREDRRRLVPVFPTLLTPRLVLRELTPADAPWYLAHFGDPAVVAGTGFPALDSVEAALAEMEQYVFGLFERRDGLRWGLELVETGELVGSAGIFSWTDDGEPSAELGYDLAPARWGHGLMAEALGAIASYAFGTLGLAKLDAYVFTGNDRSCRALERAGFRHIAVLEAHGEDEQGNPRDEHHYELRAPLAAAPA